MTNKIDTREGWLAALAEKLLPHVIAHHDDPKAEKLRFSCGYPSKGGKSKTIGECHFPTMSADGATEIFIRPDYADGEEVAAIVLHELVHAVLGPGFAHGKEFKKIALKVGLQGKMKATTAGPKALELIRPILEVLGPYPHAALTLARGGSRTQQGLAQRNVTCPHCGFRAKVYVGQLDMGRARCPDGDPLLFKGEEVE